MQLLIYTFHKLQAEVLQLMMKSLLMLVETQTVNKFPRDQ